MANEKRLIDANALLAKMRRTNRYFTIKFDIEEAPTVDAVEVVHSEWTFNDDGSGTCGHCHFTQRGVWDQDRHQNYCGVCGAKMDGGNEDEKI